MRLHRTAIAVAAGVSSVFIAAAPALAAGPYTVSVGGVASGDHAFTAAAPAGIAFNTDLVEMSCDTAGASGTVHAGANATGENVATISDTTWAGCLGPLDLPMTVEHVGAWELNVTGDATTGTSDNVTGSITSIEAYVYQSDDESACNFKVTGTVDGSFNEATQQIQITEPTDVGDLRISEVQGCYTLLTDNEEATFAADYDVTSPDGLITIE